MKKCNLKRNAAVPALKPQSRWVVRLSVDQGACVFVTMVSGSKTPPRTSRTLQNAPPDCLRDVISPGQWRTAVQRYAELRRTAIHRERPTTPPTSAIHRARPTTTPSTSATIFYEMIITVSSPIRAGQVAGQVAGPQLAGVEAS